MAEAVPPLPVVIVTVETLAPEALMKLAPLLFTGMVRVTVSFAPELVPPVTVAMMTLVCSPLTVAGEALSAIDAPAPELLVIVTALKAPLERRPCTVSWTEVPVKFVPDL
jgi:hypothetical protein